MGKVYYNQKDSRWAHHSYTSANHPYATVGTSGCGTTCVAMIVSSCKEIITPDVMSDISKQNGYRGLEGTSDELFGYVANRWGIEMKRLHSSYEAHQACKEGYFVIICCAAGLWTDGGHYILAVGANDTDIEIYDPNLYVGKFNRAGRQGKVRLNGVSAWVQIDTFKANSNAQSFFAFKIDGNITTSNETKVMYINTESEDLNVRNNHDINAAIIGSLSKGTQVIVYEENNGWSKIGYNKWVSSSYLSSTKPVTVTNTVGQTRKLTSATNLWSNANLTGTKYNYLANTTVLILANISSTVDKVRVVQTGREAYIATSAYGSSSSNISNTVGQTKRFKNATTIYRNSNLTGARYNYLANTSVKILQNVSASVDKISVIQTGRVGYVRTNTYK